MSGSLLRNWFVPKDGINRQVISADIQKYLGNDATVRPGKEKINGQEVDGYWIKAYRNLTTEMINDLRMASTKWEQEQRSGRRGNYEDSHTYRTAANVGSNGYRASTNSPQLDGAYPPPVAHAAHAPQRMPVPEMPIYDDPRTHMYPPGHPGAPMTSSFVERPVYVSHAPSRQPTNGYGPPEPFSNGPQGYGHDVVPPHSRGPQYAAQYARDPRDDPRYAQEYQDPMRQDPMRYNPYPPASVAPNGGASSPPQPISNYPPSRGPYDQYGRPSHPQTPMPDQPYARPSPSMESFYSRERPSAPPSSDARGAPRRRIG